MSWMNILKKDLTSEQKSETDAYVASQDSITVRKSHATLVEETWVCQGVRLCEEELRHTLKKSIRISWNIGGLIR